MSEIVEFIIEIFIEGILWGIDRFLNNNRIPKFLRILVVLLLFSIPIGIMSILFANINTIMASIIFIIVTLYGFYFAMKLINRINSNYAKKT